MAERNYTILITAIILAGVVHGLHIPVNKNMSLTSENPYGLNTTDGHKRDADIQRGNGRIQQHNTGIVTTIKVPTTVVLKHKYDPTPAKQHEHKMKKNIINRKTQKYETWHAINSTASTATKPVVKGVTNTTKILKLQMVKKVDKANNATTIAAHTTTMLTTIVPTSAVVSLPTKGLQLDTNGIKPNGQDSHKDSNGIDATAAVKSKTGSSAENQSGIPTKTTANIITNDAPKPPLTPLSQLREDIAEDNEKDNSSKDEHAGAATNVVPTTTDPITDQTTATDKQLKRNIDQTKENSISIEEHVKTAKTTALNGDTAKDKEETSAPSNTSDDTVSTATNPTSAMKNITIDYKEDNTTAAIITPKEVSVPLTAVKGEIAPKLMTPTNSTERPQPQQEIEEKKEIGASGVPTETSAHVKGNVKHADKNAENADSPKIKTNGVTISATLRITNLSSNEVPTPITADATIKSPAHAKRAKRETKKHKPATGGKVKSGQESSICNCRN